MSEERNDICQYVKTEEFRRLFFEHLEFFDKMMSRSGEKISGRPMSAVILFVEHCIHDEHGKPPPGYLDQEWFGALCAYATRWYRERYGAELLAASDHTITAAVLFAGTALRLDIPSMPTQPTDKPWLIKAFFPQDVLPFENPITWLKPRPSLDTLEDNVRNELCNRAKATCRTVRASIRWLDGAVFKSEELGRLRASIVGHIEKAAVDICADHRGTAIWEVVFAVEKTVKLFLAQRACGEVPMIHDVATLIERAEAQGLAVCEPALVKAMPRGREAIQFRYSEIEDPSRDELFAIYNSALTIIAHVAAQLEQGPFPPDSFYIRALRWHPKYNEGEKEKEGR